MFLFKSKLYIILFVDFSMYYCYFYVLLCYQIGPLEPELVMLLLLMTRDNIHN